MNELNVEQQELLNFIKKTLNINGFKNYLYNSFIHNETFTNGNNNKSFLHRKAIESQLKVFTEEAFSIINKDFFEKEINEYVSLILKKIESINSIEISEFSKRYNYALLTYNIQEITEKDNVSTANIEIYKDKLELFFSSDQLKFKFDQIENQILITNIDKKLENLVYQASRAFSNQASLDIPLKPVFDIDSLEQKETINKYKVEFNIENIDSFNSLDTDLYDHIINCKKSFFRDFTCKIPLKNAFSLKLDTMFKNLDLLRKVYKKVEKDNINFNQVFASGPLFGALNGKKLNVDLQSDIIDALELLLIQKDITIDIGKKKFISQKPKI